MAANPDNWYLVGDLGFLYYWRMHDYAAAAQVYMDGSTIPGRTLMDAKIMASAGRPARRGSVETARMIWTEIYNSTQDTIVRERAIQTLRGLRALEDEQQLDQLAQEYKNRLGHFPSATSDLRDARTSSRGNPVDPAGFRIRVRSRREIGASPTKPDAVNSARIAAALRHGSLATENGYNKICS